MYTFRFNPIFEQWVLLGEPIPGSLTIQPNQVEKQGGLFVAVDHPRTPFVLDAAGARDTEHLVHPAQAPVGEYELMIYRGDTDFFAWSTEEWSEWLLLLNDRIRQFHHNPHLHFLSAHLSTRAIHTLGDNYQRVGDLIATSHPIAGTPPQPSAHLLEKLHAKEKIFQVYQDASGTLLAPSAPLHPKELWYLPKTARQGIDGLEKTERDHLAHTLSLTFAVLKEEFPALPFTMQIHTGMAGGGHSHQTWWIQIYEDVYGENSLPMQPYPERFVFMMRQLLAHLAAERHA